MFTKIKNFLFGSKEEPVQPAPYKVEAPAAPAPEIKNADSTVGPVEETTAAPQVAPVQSVAGAVIEAKKARAAKPKVTKADGAKMAASKVSKPATKKAAAGSSAKTAKKPKKSKPVVL